MCELGTTTNTCGNGVRDGWEDCDGTDLGATTCAGLGLTGTLACTPDCRLDFSTCAIAPGPARCGNGVLEEGEQCDGVHFAPLSQTAAQQRAARL